MATTYTAIKCNKDSRCILFLSFDKGFVQNAQLRCNCPPVKVLLAISHCLCPRFSICMQPPEEAEPCWPSRSLWSLIAEQVHGSEIAKIRGALGNSLVDMYIDLYAEVRSLQHPHLPLWILVFVTWKWCQMSASVCKEVKRDLILEVKGFLSRTGGVSRIFFA